VRAGAQFDKKVVAQKTPFHHSASSISLFPAKFAVSLLSRRRTHSISTLSDLSMFFNSCANPGSLEHGSGQA
jgi:hypothetical protein